MVTASLRRYRPVIQIALWSTVGIVALVLLALTSSNSAQFDTWRLWVLIGSVAGVIVLAALLTRKILQLLRNYRQFAPGARLTGRTVLLFGPLVVLPLVIVYLFSLEFLNRGVDSWFRVEVRQGLTDALALSRSALDLRMREVAERNGRFAASLSSLSDRDALLRLVDERRDSGALEIVLYDAGGRVLGASTAALTLSMPAAPDEEVTRQVSRGEPFVSLEPQAPGQYLIRAAAPLGHAIGASDRRFVLAVHEVPPRLAALAEAVQTSYSRYGNIDLLREPLLDGFRLTLTLVLLAVMLAALYGAIFSAQLLFKPIQDLMEGTRAVAKGDLGTRLPLSTRDEMGFLVQSFNDMTKRLRRAREDAEKNQLAVANEAADAILGQKLADRIGRPLHELSQDGDGSLLQPFVKLLLKRFAEQHNDFREQLDFQAPGGLRHLMCACVPLALEADSDALPGHVVVFDDITALLTAQREAAWGEVARRLAHEIKNPLTPIQLSAERMRRRYLGVMTGQDAEVIDRATRTIVQQVETMKRMVNAFSEYARAPEVSMSRFSLNQLVSEVCDLYRPQNRVVTIEVDLDPKLDSIEADRGRVRQILNNLLANSQEALEHAATGRIEVRTRRIEGESAQFAEIVVADNGPGFTREILDRAFDPYVTSKPRGTGLGLAIVRKIVEEHGGDIVAGNRTSGGAELRLTLPLLDAGRMAAARERRNELRKELA
jgi:nitrogen fixation/metabolism regulation signal transduction histidine kinase